MSFAQYFWSMRKRHKISSERNEEYDRFQRHLLLQNFANASIKATDGPVVGVPLAKGLKGVESTKASVLAPRGARRIPYTFSPWYFYDNIEYNCQNFIQLAFHDILKRNSHNLMTNAKDTVQQTFKIWSRVEDVMVNKYLVFEEFQ